MDVAAARAQIPATANLTYFNTGYSGPSPRCVQEAVDRILRLQAEGGPACPDTLEAGRAARTRARNAFARILGADPAEATLTDNTTRGINIVLSGLSWSADDEIITSATEHMGVLMPVYELRRREGVVLKFVDLDPKASEAGLLETLEAAITPRTKMLVLNHMFTTGLCLPAAAVQEMAHRHGVQVLFDAAQCAGQIPLDVHGWDCDYYAVPGHKWMLGPWGTGALYVRKELMPDLWPLHVSGGAAASYDMQGGYEPQREKPEKFEVSTGSPALFAGATAAAEFLFGFGMDEVSARWRSLTARLRAGLAGIPTVTLVSPPDGQTASGLVVFAVQGHAPQEIVDELWKQKVVVRPVTKPEAIRASVDFFNTEDEIDRLLDLVKKLASQKA